MANEFTLKPSTLKTKKWTVITPDNKRINFGQKGAEDYTIHRDSKRRDSYISRHRSREDWTSTGINTAGFWSKWLLWSEPDLKSAIKGIENKFKIKLSYIG